MPKYASMPLDRSVCPLQYPLYYWMTPFPTYPFRRLPFGNHTFSIAVLAIYPVLAFRVIPNQQAFQHPYASFYQKLSLSKLWQVQ